MKVNLTPLTRFIEHLPKNGDLELSLLKCHLLVEELLTKVILDSTKQPNYVKNARLSFSQKISIARSFSDLENKTWLWGC